MIKVSNTKLISVLTKLLLLLLVAKLISFAVWLYLPSNGVELSTKENYQAKYQKVSFKGMIKVDSVKKTQSAKKYDSGKSITNMLLKGLYGKGNNGFVIVAMKSAPKKTKIVEVGESYEGYKLESISPKSSKFSKNGLDFILSIQKIKTDGIVSKIKKKDTSTIYPEYSPTVNRGDIAYYAKNPKQIWRDISIKELRDGKKIKGFKVTRIASGSRFASLGLQKGDLIIKANNVRLKSYKDALDIYSKIATLDVVQIVVVRDNQEVELVYEIN